MTILYTSPNHETTRWPGLDKDIINLRLDELVSILSAGGQQTQPDQLCELFCRDRAEIEYRQQILRGLEGHPALMWAFEQAADRMDRISAKLSEEKHQLVPLRKEIAQYYILREYLAASDGLIAALEAEPGLPAELSGLKDTLRENRAFSGADAVMAKLSAVDMNWLNLRSVWIGVNLGEKPQLKPYALVFGEFREKPYENNSIFDNELVEDGLGLSRLKPMKLSHNQNYFERLILINFRRRHREQIKAFEEVFAFNRAAVEEFCELAVSLRFYLACSSFARRLTEAGCPVCLPEIAPAEEDAFVARQLLSAGLILRSDKQAVPNDLDLTGRFFLLTGANHSGKTECLISVAQAQWLAQLGCYVPAESLRVSPVPAIMSLFSSGETQRYDESRMGNEIRQFSEISAAMTPHTLLLLNEPMTSTNPDEGAALCCDMVSLILQKEGRGIMVTHLYELFGMLDEKELDKSRIGSLVTTTLLKEDGSTQKTYKVEEREPECQSYALELSRQAGITLEQFIQDARRDNFEIPVSADLVAKLHGR